MFEVAPIPTPFEIGPVNAYLAGRTVIDPGPDSDDAWAALTDALDDRGLAPGDVEQVLLTHPHPDHFGIAKRLRDRGASVCSSPAAATVVGDFEARLATEQTYFVEFFQRCGMDADTATTLTQLPEAFLSYVEDVTVDRALADGDSVDVAGEPVVAGDLVGHAPGELRFTVGASDESDGADPDPSGGVAVVGDHVLPDHTPTPFLQPPPDGETDADRPRILPAYNDSLRDLRERGLDRLLPGHGDAIDEPTARIGSILDAHEERTDEVYEALTTPKTPHAIMRSLFGDLPATEQFGGMSEAVGHLDVLEARGQVEKTTVDGELVYERTDTTRSSPD